MSDAGLLVMAYGSPADLGDLEAYYTHIRRGRPPTAEQLAELRARYEAIGGVSPLRDITERQGAAVLAHLQAEHGPDRWIMAHGNKHAAPFIEDGVAELADAGVSSIVGLVLAPHWSAFSVGAYHDRATTAAADADLPYVGIESWHLLPELVTFHATALREVLDAARTDRPGTHKVLFSAHSLPERVLVDDPYPDQLRATAAAVAARCDLRAWSDWATCWQSAGRTPEPWRGPDIGTVIADLAGTGRAEGVVVAAIGFVADHLELRYDLDIEAAAIAERHGLAFARTRAVNDDDEVMAALAREVASVHGDATASRADDRSRARRSSAAPRVVVVGAGITGLSAARAVLIAAPDADVEVVESAARVGGKILTSPFADRDVDCGADAFLARVPEAVALCRELGLGDDLVSPAATRAALHLDGRLHPFPADTVLGVPLDPERLRGSDLVSDAGIDRALAEDDLEPEPWTAEQDDAVGALVRRRLGDEVFERLVAPLLAGVNCGDADELSVRAGAPQFAEAMVRHGTLGAGLRRLRDEASGGGGAQAPVFHGLRGGTGTLIDALVADLEARGATLTTSCAVIGCEPTWAPGRSHPLYRVRLDDGADGATRHADAVVLTTPDAATARLLTPFAPEAASVLGEVSYASAVLVTLAVRRDEVDFDDDLSGFLVGPAEGLLLTACSWASSKWAHLDTGDGLAILRASAGRVGDDRSRELDDDALVDALVADLGATMGLRGAPVEVRITRWPEALPQFRPGHLDRMARLRRDLADCFPGLCVAGAGIGGLGIPACIRQGHEIATSLRDVGLIGASAGP